MLKIKGSIAGPVPSDVLIDHVAKGLKAFASDFFNDKSWKTYQ